MPNLMLFHRVQFDFFISKEKNSKTLLEFSSLGYLLAAKFFLYFSSLSCHKIGYIFVLKSSSTIGGACLVLKLLVFTAYKYQIGRIRNRSLTF